MTDKKIIINDINVSELTSEQLACMDRYSVAHLFIKLVEALSRTEDDYNKVQRDRVKMWADNTDLTEKLKRKEQELEKICKAFDIEYVIDKETGSLIGRCNKLNNKEQECEELKEKYKWYDHYKGQALFNKNLCNKKSDKIDQLKADREEALKQLEFVRTLNTVKETEIRKLSKTLIEIKGIAERSVKTEDYLLGMEFTELVDNILQKLART